MIVQHKWITGLAALALAVAAACSALIAPGAIGGPPSCAISNARTHKGYDPLQAAVDAAKALAQFSGGPFAHRHKRILTPERWLDTGGNGIDPILLVDP